MSEGSQPDFCSHARGEVEFFVFGLDFKRLRCVLLLV
jgi:hypothetical protein